MQLSQKQLDWIGRIALFLIFFWFGFLKVLMISPADELVDALREMTIPFFNSTNFFFFLGCVECLIGILFLIPKATRIVIIILLLHMLTTFFPLILLPEISWQAPFVPTLVGQYIIKNVALVALALIVSAHTHQKST